MSKGALLRWAENRYLQKYLHGRGIEIGALWRKFPIPPGVTAWYLDRMGHAELEQHYPELRGKVLGVDALSEAVQLPVRPASLDFVIASHVLEHLPDPLRALRAWYEALAPGGALLLKIPDKRYTFDRARERTTLAHLIQEHQQPETYDRRAHFADWMRGVGGKNPNDPEFDAAVEDLMRQDYSIHYHVWIDQDLQEIISYSQQAWGFQWKAVVFWGAHFYRKETTVVLRKS